MKVRVILFLVLVAVGSACDPNNLVVPPVAKGQSARTGISGHIETIAGLGPANFGYTGDGGTASAAKLGWLTGVAVDPSFNVYVTDGASNTVRKIDAATNMITTIAGTFLGFNVIDPTPFAGDGGSAKSAHLNAPLGMSVDHAGNVYVVDGANELLRVVTAADGKIASLAGKPMGQGYDGDGGPATSATFWNLYGVTVTIDGTVYLADASNNVIRKVDHTTGKISTIAGLGPDHSGYTGDSGPAAQATLNFPRALATDSQGNLYIADNNNHVVRKISGGTITTLAGNGSAGYSGDGGAALSASFASLSGIAVDSDGNVYVADAVSNVIRKITVSSGIISTVAGTGTTGYTGDGGSATAATLSGPLAVAVDASGNIFIADSGNSVVRVVYK